MNSFPDSDSEFCKDLFKETKSDLYELAERSANKKYMADAINTQGFTFFRRGDYKQAMSCYERSIKLNKEISYKKGLANNYKNIGTIYRVKGNYNDALSFFDQALSLDPTNPDFWNLKGMALRSLGRYDEATDCYNKSLEIEPRDKQSS